MTASSGSLAAPFTCTEFQRCIRLYIANPAVEQSMLAEALAHLQTCARCQVQLGKLVQGLLLDQEDPFTCAEAEALLPDYVDAQLLGTAKDMQWNALQLHLATCPHCTEVSMELRQLVVWVLRLSSTK